MKNCRAPKGALAGAHSYGQDDSGLLAQVPVLWAEAEAAEKLRVSLSTLQRIRRAGEISHVVVGARAFYTPAMIAEYVDRQKRPVAALGGTNRDG